MVTTHGASWTISSTHLQCLSDSYLSCSVKTVLPFFLDVNLSLQHPTMSVVLGNLGNPAHSHSRTSTGNGLQVFCLFECASVSKMKDIKDPWRDSDCR